MRTSHFLTLLATVVLTSATQAQTVGAHTETTGFTLLPKEMERPELEASLEFITKQTTYGLVDNDEPILTPSAAVSWYGFSFETAFIFDLTKENAQAYGDRKGRYQEWTFGPGYAIQLGEVELSASYVYEYHPRAMIDSPDTQFVNFGIGLPDIFLKPALALEVDIDNESGAAYLLFTIGHDFTLIEDTLTLELSGGIGAGNSKRNTYDFDHDKVALKDAYLSAALVYQVTEGLSFSAYLTGSTQLVGRHRDAIAADDGDSDLVYAGLAMTYAF